MSDNKNIVFDFGRDSDTEDHHCKSSIQNNEKESEDGNLSDLDSNLGHIQKIDLYDRLNFKRLAIKRNSRKGKTQMISNKKFNIEKLTEDITKITEEECFASLTNPIREKERKKTIRFADKRTTYQYPKEREELKLINNDTRHESDEELELEDK
jgi:hypothetical protein